MPIGVEPPVGNMKNHDRSGFFEEFVGNLFQELGCETEKHPPDGNGKSEYLATTPDGESFYIEATV